MLRGSLRESLSFANQPITKIQRQNHRNPDGGFDVIPFGHGLVFSLGRGFGHFRFDFGDWFRRCLQQPDIPFARADDAIEAIDLDHLGFGEFFFRHGAIGIEIFGHGVELQMTADEDVAGIQVRGDVGKLIVGSFARGAHVHIEKVRLGRAGMKPAVFVGGDFHPRRAPQRADLLVDDDFDLLDGVVHHHGVGGDLGVLVGRVGRDRKSVV